MPFPVGFRVRRAASNPGMGADEVRAIFRDWLEEAGTDVEDRPPHEVAFSVPLDSLGKLTSVGPGLGCVDGGRVLLTPLLTGFQCSCYFSTKRTAAISLALLLAVAISAAATNTVPGVTSASIFEMFVVLYLIAFGGLFGVSWLRAMSHVDELAYWKLAARQTPPPEERGVDRRPPN